eukprot:g723.t1
MSSTRKKKKPMEQQQSIQQKQQQQQKEQQQQQQQQQSNMSDMVLLQRFQRHQQNVAALMKTMTLLKREEELGQESSKGLIKSLLELKDLNKALAAAAHQRRQSDQKQFGSMQEQLAKKLAESASKLEKREVELKKVKNENRESAERIKALEQELQSVRMLAAQFQKEGQVAVQDLAQTVNAKKSIQEKYTELQGKYHALQLEKDRLQQRFVSVTQQMAAVAGSQFAQMQQMQEDGSTSDESDSDITKSDPRNWSVMQVGEWLENIGLGKFVVGFVQNSVDGDMLFDLEVDDLDEVGVVEKSDRKKVIRELEKLRERSVNRGEGAGDSSNNSSRKSR